ncbi:MAG: MBL fold metallo-hydrolase [Gammaproteobacteria bacterium]|nr:MBL fold metallo-hydrolase [Gammaproteobacteria bacterium]
MKYYLVLFSMLFTFSSISVAHNVNTPKTIEQYALDKVSNHIYVVHGRHELPSPENRGFMNNPGAILTKNGVIIVDPGSSAEIGKQLLDKIREVSDKPIIAVFNTHVHGDHWLGNNGIRELYPEVPIYAHKNTITRIGAGEGEDWLEIYMKMTKGIVSGTQVTIPDIGLAGGEELKIDNVTLKIHHTGHAHTNTDIMIEVVEEKSLFFGDIVSAKMVPNSVVPKDANFKGTIAAIKTMLDRDINLFIPGHGRSGGREVPDASLRFLDIMYSSTEKYYKQGLQDFEMKGRIVKDLAEFNDWDQFNEIGRVLSYVYKEVENDNF